MLAESPVQARPAEVPSLHVPWSAADCWLGVGLLVFLLLGTIVAATVASYFGGLQPFPAFNSKYFEAAIATALELLYVVPAVVILAWRRASWRSLGFRNFNGSTLGIGCGLLVLTYMAMIVYSTILTMLKIQTQGDSLVDLLSAAKWPVGFVIPTVIAAPFAEEVFFRGFLFQGLRSKLGWNSAALLSSSIFALLHLQLAAMIPTFLLGYLFCFTFHKSNSIWPGIILHFLINSLGICAALALLPFLPEIKSVHSFVISLTWLS